MFVAGTCDGKVDSAGFLISDRGLVVNGMLREKFGFAVSMRKPRYHAGFVSAGNVPIDRSQITTLRSDAFLPPLGVDISPKIGEANNSESEESRG